MGRRTWLKIYADAWLRGTLREETAEIRGVWADLLALAADSAYGDDGTIQLAPAVGLTDVQISDILKLTREEWARAKPRLIATDRISVDEGNVLHIVNWRRYQSEYARQKRYRGKGSETSSEKKLEKPGPQSQKPKVTPESDTRKLHRERDRDRERDKDQKQQTDSVGQSGQPDSFVKVVVGYLNSAIGSRFKPTTKKTLRLITARFKEGWELLDFRKVIDLKCAQWGCEKEMRGYRRPETLFGSKFESYVNEAELDGNKGKRDMDDIVGRGRKAG